MNSDQRRNIENTIHALGDSLFSAWNYLELLKGLQLGARADPENLQVHAISIDVIYRAVFDALYAVIGTVSDRAKGTLSLPNLISIGRRYSQDPEVEQVLGAARQALNDPKHAPLAKLSNWRHQHVAHRTPDSRVEEFYSNNRLQLADVEEAIGMLDRIVNDVSAALTRTCYDWRTAAEPVAGNCASLLTRNPARVELKQNALR